MEVHFWHSNITLITLQEEEVTMLLHELRNETLFSLPENRDGVYRKIGMYPGGRCLVENPRGLQVNMSGGTEVVTAPAPKKEARAR